MISSAEFFEYDFKSTLFPMETGRYLISHGQAQIDAYIQRCLSKNEADAGYQFLAQTRVYAAKPHGHLRRTVKLDPVAEYFMYDVIYRNRSKFRKPFQDRKKHFGYRFDDGEPINPAASYTAFRQAIFAYQKAYGHSLSFDVSSYFNNVYHHDIVSWFANIGAEADDVNALGTFLRQSNSGRSIDCLPQGIYPAKMIGNDFLRFVEQHHAVKSDAVVRFMDDFVLFSNSSDRLTEDFYHIQKLLGQKGLSVNPIKTQRDVSSGSEVEKGIDRIKQQLLKKKRQTAKNEYDLDADDAEKHVELSPAEIEYLRGLLRNKNLSEEDAELVLSVFRDYKDDIRPVIGQFALGFPHLAKSIWSFCNNLDAADFIAEFISDASKSSALQEYQLFWFAWILQDYLMQTSRTAELISNLYNHPNATIISKAKILEIPDNRFGLVEMRDEHLVAGRSDWLAWASAVGHRNLPPISRNHRLEYFGNSSQINHLIKSIVTAAQ